VSAHAGRRADLAVSFRVSKRTKIYQPIVRVLFEARQAARMALTTAEVAAELARHDEVRFQAPEHVDAHLRQLHAWRSSSALSSPASITLR
jgi:hypothetical protein